MVRICSDRTVQKKCFKLDFKETQRPCKEEHVRAARARGQPCRDLPYVFWPWKGKCGAHSSACSTLPS